MSITPKVILTFAVSCFVVLYLLIGITSIELGEVGLQVRMIGTDRGKTTMLPPGTRWVDPTLNDVFTYDARLKQYSLEDVPASTKDGQPIQVDLSLEMGLVAKNIPTLHRDIGRSYYAQVVYPAVRSTLRNTTTEQLSDEIYTGDGRAYIQNKMEKLLRAKLEPLGFRIAINLREIVFTNSDFVALLEDKAKAQQTVEIEKRKAEAAVNIAKKVANIAEGEKQKVIKAAEAEKEKIRLTGLGQRLAKEQEAKGNLALAKAKAEGERLSVQAYGDGGTYASVKWAESIGPKMQVWGVPTGAPGTTTLMDVNGILQGAFRPAAK